MLHGCSTSKMPSPVVFHDGRIDPCARVPPTERTNNVDLLYATSRQATGIPAKPSYSNEVSSDLTLGVATVQLGGDDMTWERLCAISTGKEVISKLPMTITQMTEVARLTGAADAHVWADLINRQLDRTPNKQVNIYVHGCCTDLDPEILTAAPFFHFLGRTGAMIVFDWPSRQRISMYRGDVERAREAAPHLAHLIEFLARSTKAERINILAYSAGGHAMNEALILLREARAGADAPSLQRELHIGNAVYAGSDLDLKGFAAEDLTRLLDLPSEVTVYISNQDSALKMASMFGGSKVGRPNAKVLTRDELDRLAAIEKLHVIDVSDIPGAHQSGGMAGHGYWYANEWVMSDILMIFRWTLSPQDRGLARTRSGKWIFPQDYPSRATQSVLDRVGQDAK
jgi:esterase/lipase superfamily enzyme